MFIFLPMSKNWLIFYAIVIIAVGSYQMYEDSKLNQFRTVTECVTFLVKDKTNLYTWTASFTCEDFTEKLIQNAKESGYLLKQYSLYGNELRTYQTNYISYCGGSWGTGDGHAVCTFSVGDRKYIIESQTDAIFEMVNGRFVGLYRGES